MIEKYKNYILNVIVFPCMYVDIKIKYTLFSYLHTYKGTLYR